MFQNKDKLIFIYVLYQIVKYLSIFFMNYFCIFYIVSHAIFLCIIFIRKACFPGRFPLSARLVSFPCKLSLRLACSKIQANIPEGISWFCKGSVARPFEPPAFVADRWYICHFKVITPCPWYAHGMPMLCSCHAHGMPISCTILWAWLYSLTESKIQALC